jgi:hypothetical protein
VEEAGGLGEVGLVGFLSLLHAASMLVAMSATLAAWIRAEEIIDRN